MMRCAAVAKKAKSNANGEGDAQGESVAGYFRKVFAENPKLLKERSNEELFRRWLEDHPGHNEVPSKVKTGLQNIKSVLRKAKGKKKRGKRPEAAAQPQAEVAQRPARRPPSRELEALEEQIDECMALAKHL